MRRGHDNTPTEDTPLAAILHPDLKDAQHEDVDDLYKFVRYCETGDKTPLKRFSLDRIDVLYARYGAEAWPHVRALIVHRDELREKRATKISRWEKVILAIIAMLLGAVGGLLHGFLKSL